MDSDDLSALPLADADRLARARIEHHRAEMGRWRRLRAARVLAAVDSGTSAAEVATELGVHVDRVYRLLREARGA